jgi:hypothetical protein
MISSAMQEYIKNMQVPNFWHQVKKELPHIKRFSVSDFMEFQITVFH